jgi:hypothetical protein
MSVMAGILRHAIVKERLLFYRQRFGRHGGDQFARTVLSTVHARTVSDSTI